METLIDTSVWIDFFHPKTPLPVRETARQLIIRSDAVICEPVWAEIFHGMPDRHADRVQRHLATVPMLPTPSNLWREVVPVVRTCIRKGNPVGTLDALIAVIALAHGARIVSFDHGFLPLQKHCGVALELLPRPT
jgi:predicted nucleic acid-binding protein